MGIDGQKIEGAKLLIVDDDKAFVQRLARAMEKRGFVADTAESVAEANAYVRSGVPDYAVIDMRLDDGNGLDVVEALRERDKPCRVIILTGFGNIATAVTEIIRSRRVATITRLNTSRPRLSVPNQCDQEGGCNARAASVANGS